MGPQPSAQTFSWVGFLTLYQKPTWQDIMDSNFKHPSLWNIQRIYASIGSRVRGVLEYITDPRALIGFNWVGFLTGFNFHQSVLSFNWVNYVRDYLNYYLNVFMLLIIILCKILKSYAGCLTCWCPCITFGRIAEIVDKGSSCKYKVNRNFNQTNFNIDNMLVSYWVVRKLFYKN